MTEEERVTVGKLRLADRFELWCRTNIVRDIESSGTEPILKDRLI